MHGTINHQQGEYVSGEIHTQGIESFWTILKRGWHGIYHHMSKKHIARYVHEFSGRNNKRDLDTVCQLAGLATAMRGRRLKFRELVA